VSIPVRLRDALSGDRVRPVRPAAGQSRFPAIKVIDEIGDSRAFRAKVLQMDSTHATGAKAGASSPND